MDVNVTPVEDRRLDAEIQAAALDVVLRRLDRFFHHIAQLAGGAYLALAGHRHRLDRQQLAANLGPGQSGGDAHQIFAFRLAEPKTAHAGILLQVASGDLDLLGLV